MVLSAKTVQVDGRVLLVGDVEICVFEIFIRLIQLGRRLIRKVVELIITIALAQIVKEIIVVVRTGIAEVHAQLPITFECLICHLYAIYFSVYLADNSQ